MDAESLRVEGRPGGPLGTVTYWLTDLATGAWGLVDPTYEFDLAWRDRWRSNLTAPDAIFVTHGHFDHVGGLATALRRFPEAPVWAHAETEPMLADGVRNGSQWCGMPYEPAAANRRYAEGDIVRLGRSELKVIEAPGHCPGSVLLLCGRQLLAGDLLFRGSVGRWDLPGGDYDTLAATVREKVMTLPDETRVYPGHGESTTIGEERRGNEIVRQMLAGVRVD